MKSEREFAHLHFQAKNRKMCVDVDYIFIIMIKQLTLIQLLYNMLCLQANENVLLIQKWLDIYMFCARVLVLYSLYSSEFN